MEIIEFVAALFVMATLGLAYIVKRQRDLIKEGKKALELEVARKNFFRFINERNYYYVFVHVLERDESFGLWDKFHLLTNKFIETADHSHFEELAKLVERHECYASRIFRRDLIQAKIYRLVKILSDDIITNLTGINTSTKELVIVTIRHRSLDKEEFLLVLQENISEFINNTDSQDDKVLAKNEMNKIIRALA